MCEGCGCVKCLPMISCMFCTKASAKAVAAATSKTVQLNGVFLITPQDNDIIFLITWLIMVHTASIQV
jgi:hypothetical protein